MTWTREMDAWIARHCEGLEVLESNGMYCVFAGWSSSFGREPEKLYKPVYSYSTDSAAAIRAAEAWRKQGERWYDIESPSRTCEPQLFIASLYGIEERPIIARGEGIATALAQALLRATGWPA